MLKKKLCIKCRNKWIGWHKDDEQYWEEKRLIFCPPDYKEGESRMREIKDKPPEKCPFILEHTI